jgi:hypothetical protein
MNITIPAIAAMIGMRGTIHAIKEISLDMTEISKLVDPSGWQ